MTSFISTPVPGVSPTTRKNVVVGLANYEKLSVSGGGRVTVGYNDFDFFEKIKMGTKIEIEDSFYKTLVSIFLVRFMCAWLKS